MQSTNHFRIELETSILLLLGWPKSLFSYFHMMAVVVLSCLLTPFETILLNCIVTAVMSTCILKNIKIGEFLCTHFNIEDGRK